jgi:GPH family glycoside/pentoside/hexuronide:cation symporter
MIEERGDPEHSTAPSERLSSLTLTAYALPMAGFAAATMALSLYLMKYSTDVLLVAPGAMGTIFMVARLWDAVTDPLVGQWSDRTKTRWGRRRPWMMGAALPILLALVMVWAPPASLGGWVLVAWVTLALLFYETAQTAFIVPYTALGMEITDDHHERTRLFGWRQMIGAPGFLVGLAFIYAIRTAEDPRSTALLFAALGGLIVAGTIAYAAAKLPERREFAGRAGESLGGAMTDVWRNPHARLLFIVYGIEAFGAGSIAVMVPYIMEDVVGRADLTESLIAFYAVPQFLLIPLWIRLAKRVGKKKLWLWGMAAMIPGYGGIIWVNDVGPMFVIVLVTILACGIGIVSIVVPSIKADIIDYDELQTGERKEGAYTAAWNFIRKAGGGLALGLGGLLLQIAGYDGAAEVQTETVRTTILLIAGGIPAAGYGIGMILFSRFSFNEAEHADVLAQLRDRRGDSDD